MQGIRTDETDKSVAQIASLEQDEDHENDDNRCCRKWRQQGLENALQDLNRPQRRLVHFNSGVDDLPLAPLALVRAAEGPRFLPMLFSSPWSASAAFSTMRAPKAELLTASSFLLITT